MADPVPPFRKGDEIDVAHRCRSMTSPSPTRTTSHAYSPWRLEFRPLGRYSGTRHSLLTALRISTLTEELYFSHTVMDPASAGFGTPRKKVIMVEKIAATSPTSSSSATQINHSMSIASEPDRAWVAERQAQITADLEMMNEERAVLRDEDHNDASVDEDEQASERHLDHHPGQAHHPEGIAEDERLSGESIRIGTGNLEEEVPFGEHVGFV